MQQVVGVAVLAQGRVLAARRTTPPAAAGHWELPGGKVEPGESVEAAAVREIGEELGCTVAVTGALDGAVPVGPGLELVVVTAELRAGQPVPTEHDAVRWLDADQLDEVPWVGADRPFVAQLPALLGGRPKPPVVGTRAMFFDQDVARLVATRLRHDGFAADVRREAFAGEDDDEDPAWVVVSDCPPVMLELLVEEHDGWLDSAPPTSPSPLVLPTAPRRRHREGP